MKKDEGWNSYFQDNRRYADIINGIGCKGEQFVNADDLSEADTREKKKQRDIVRKVAFGVSYAVIGLENQEYTDYELPLRCMNYDVARYQKQANEIGKEVRANRKGLSPGEYMYGFRKDSKLYPTVTFALYSGENWDAATSLHEILNFTNIPEPLKDQVQDYKINVVDIRHFENTGVFKTDVKQVFDFIRCSGDKEKLIELVQNDEYYQHMEADAFEVVTQYTNSKELVNMEEYKTEGGKRNLCKGILDLMADSEAAGKEVGRSEGMELGRSEGIELGRSEGMELGRSEGIKGLVDTLRELEQRDDYILSKIMEKFSLSKEAAEKFLSEK